MSTNTEQQIVNGIIKHGIDILEHCVADQFTFEKYSKRIQDEFLKYPLPKTELDTTNWFMPDAYKDMDIRKYVLERCPNDSRYTDRVNVELDEYEKRNLFPLLKQMVYIIDTLRKNNIVWGVGRGSSVASYVLFLLGVHRVDSVKYDIPLNEFFKGDNNG